jgi:hypothetical protein
MPEIAPGLFKRHREGETRIEEILKLVSDIN